MNAYQHILAAVDFSDENDVVGKRAIELAQLYKARLSLIHVVEPIPDIIDQPMMLDIEKLQELIIDNAEKRLGAYADRLGLADASRWLKHGSTKREILETAKEQGIDLIVLGSHGRHGIGLLLGSTPNAILHGADCDVLTVRIKN